MFSFKNRRLFIYTAPVTMLTSFDGLTGLITNNLKQDPMNGDVFIFINNRRTRMKILKWEPGGFVMIYKRLEEGTFDNPAMGIDANYLPISRSKFATIITGKGPRKTRKRSGFSQH